METVTKFPGPQTIDIRPGVSVLAVLRHLNYKPWFALAEFVDNSLGSYLQHKERLEALHGKNFKLRVSIDIYSSSPASISIKDNAAGIFASEFSRAFRPAVVPPDRSGLSEFGMGMKSAACWFAPIWTVRTSALNDVVSRTVSFDIDNIVNDNISELKIHEEIEVQNHHYTEVRLQSLHHVPQGRTIGKLKEHLTDIYRDFIRKGLLELRFNGELLRYEEPKVLIAPYFRNQSVSAQVWRKEIVFDFGEGLSVKGFAAIRETGNTTKAGFSLFRRGRVIQGSGDDGYRPSQVFGSANSYRYQRIFGELHLDGFEVSHTKDGFRWDDNEEPFLDLLREELDRGGLPLLKQAEGYRSRVPQDRAKVAANQAVDNTVQSIEENLGEILEQIANAEPVETPFEEYPIQPNLAEKEFQILFRGNNWNVKMQITSDPAESDWLVLTDSGISSSGDRKIDMRLSLIHPFMIRFAQDNANDIEALLRLAAALSISEVLARDAGVRNAGTIRRNINDILREALSSP